MSKEWEALGLLSTIHPNMEINVDDPLGMAKKIVEHVDSLTEDNADLREKVRELEENKAGAGAWILEWMIADKYKKPQAPQIIANAITRYRDAFKRAEAAEQRIKELEREQRMFYQLQSNGMGAWVLLDSAEQVRSERIKAAQKLEAAEQRIKELERALGDVKSSMYLGKNVEAVGTIDKALKEK